MVLRYKSFEGQTITINNITKSIHQHTIDELRKEFSRSQEIFIKDHRNRYPTQDADAWKILEVASLGTLSKLYKNIQHQLPEKSNIAKEMGLNLHSELSSWLEAITYVRNIIAHHSRLWSRSMVKTPIEKSETLWAIGLLILFHPFKQKAILDYFLLNLLVRFRYPRHHIKSKILDLFNNNPNTPIHKLGFLNNWNKEPVGNRGLFKPISVK